MVISAITSNVKNLDGVKDVKASGANKTDDLMSNPISFGKSSKTEKVDNEKEIKDKKALAQGKAYTELMSGIKVLSSGKPLLHKFTDMLLSSIKELQGIVNSFMKDAGALIFEKEGLDKNDPNSEKRAKEIDAQIQQMKDDAKPKLERIYCRLYALEEASSVMMTTFGKDKAENVNIDKFMGELEAILSSKTGSSDEIKAKIDELLKSSEDLHPELKKENGKNAQIPQVNLASANTDASQKASAEPANVVKADKPKLSLVA